MALTARLNLRQAQSMTMTPQLLQSIRLLQFTHAELEQFIEDQIERNPLLERPQETAEPQEGGGEAQGLPQSAAGMADRLDASLENVFPDDPGRSEPDGHRVRGAPMPGLPSMGVPDGDWPIEDFAAGKPTLRDHVMAQAALAFREPAAAAIAAELADRLDERGYLEADLDALADRLGTSAESVSDVLSTLQGFEPAGIFARDLAECLALQCARRDRLDPAMHMLLDNLDLLARRDFRALSRLCGVDQADLVDMLAEIRTLDPRPGLAYDTAPVQAVVHDVEVRAGADGAWQVELNRDALPRVLVDRDYYATVTAGALNGEEKSFMTQCLQDAHWLERSLDQRANTILKVAAEIVRRQDGFLVSGVSGLRPLTMKAVAEEIAMHESTVSRVVANKYMLTPRGIFELRFFFTGAIGGTEGEGGDHSAESVRQRIRALIDAEPPEKILSDDALVGLLRGEGVDIARRTVAKYRESMNIASSVQRRREKRARALIGA